ncbi:MAG: hypothetical protein LBR38_01680 [Synergistaceae bacterium]|jgi:hypothetical protein|nr:hypothetical protein [Synergistaceae bacterium]
MDRESMLRSGKDVRVIEVVDNAVVVGFDGTKARLAGYDAAEFVKAFGDYLFKVAEARAALDEVMNTPLDFSPANEAEWDSEAAKDFEAADAAEPALPAETADAAKPAWVTEPALAAELEQDLPASEVIHIDTVVDTAPTGDGEVFKVGGEVISSGDILSTVTRDHTHPIEVAVREARDAALRG